MWKHSALLQIICTDSNILWFSHLPTLAVSFSKKHSVLLFSQRRSRSVFWRLWLQRKTRSLSPFRHNCYFCSDRWVHFFFFHFSISLDDSDLYKQLCARNVIFAQGASFQKFFHQHCVLSSWSASVIEIVMSPVILQLVMDCKRFVISVWVLSGYFASPNLLLWCSLVQAFLWDSQNNYIRISVIIDNWYLFRVLNWSLKQSQLHWTVHPKI